MDTETHPMGIGEGRVNDPVTIIIFDASGDLAHRKLIPALYSYSGTWNKSLPEADERLLLEALHGDSNLFTRSDEAEWRVVQPILEKLDQLKPAPYPVGSWGSPEAAPLFQNMEGHWKNEPINS